MKRMMKTLLALVASAALWAGHANAVVIDINTNVAAGGNVSVEVSVSDLNGLIVGGYDLDILFDDAVLAFVDVVFGCALGDCDGTSIAFAPMAPLVGNLIDVAEVSLWLDQELIDFGYQDGQTDFVLFTINFTCDEQNCDFGEFAFLWDEFNDVKCDDNQVCFPVSVPEPGTLGLLGLGLLGLGLARRRRMS